LHESFGQKPRQAISFYRPEPQCGLNDVLIRVDRTGIYGTGLHIYKWMRGRGAPFLCRWLSDEFVGKSSKSERTSQFLRG
jgi:threonine dehydrogenase-like Zn-dependent dehydrogenase